MSLQYKLLWLNGPLKGRELQLPSGQLTIGSDGDILAKLEGTEEITLEINDAGIHLISNVTGLIDADEANFEAPLPYHKAIEVAGVAFVVAPVEEALSLIELPSTQIANTTQTVKKTGTRKRSNKIPWGLLSLAAILALLIIYIVTLPDAPIEKKQTIQRWTENQLVKEALPHVKTMWSSNTQVTLSGYYGDPITFNAFIESLKTKNILYTQDAIYLKQLLSNVRMILSENHYTNLQVTLDKEIPGNINISGAIQSGEQWDNTAKMLKNIHGIKEWKVTNQASTQVKQLITLLRDKQLLEGLMITRANEMIRVTGQVSNKDEPAIRSIIHQVQKNSSGTYKINFLNIPIHDELNKLLPSEIVSIGGNNTSPYIELDNGDRLWQKTRLDNGYIIDFIDEYGIDLSNKGEVIHVPFIF
ncbi:type III secretion system inner membrane ring subunit SctD [Shewanella surugensis]|uniref:Type III secretion system inner membrane ring subunit SctD n=1 Tax=Shewanella surugensis TaxID=212020 RepID=A0ABT0L7T3_9GAMM|nr:type III secretion system inner membrane ring subunit SctD [Shewanella surugensis]MCL1123703.1 type III secretion system inner membrane ring subunit SctD [Shewanella surugensis]